MLVLAAAVCGVRLVLSYDKSNKKLVENLDVSVPTYDPSGEMIQTTFQNNILFICYDEDNSETQMMFVMNVDSVSRSLNFLLLPREIKFNVASAGIVGTFGEMYNLFSSSRGASCASAISAFFEFDINYYFCISTDEMGKFINSFCTEDNGVIVDVPIDISYRDYDKNININYRSGAQYMYGDDVVNFLSFYKTFDGSYTKEMLNFYDGTDAKRMDIVARFIEGFITQKFFEASTDTYLRNFTDLISPYLTKGDTNLSENILGIISQILSVANAQKLGFYMPLGDLSFNGRIFYEFNGYIRNLAFDESFSPSTAEEILTTRFKTTY